MAHFPGFCSDPRGTVVEISPTNPGFSALVRAREGYIQVHPRGGCHPRGVPIPGVPIPEVRGTDPTGSRGSCPRKRSDLLQSLRDDIPDLTCWYVVSVLHTQHIIKVFRRVYLGHAFHLLVRSISTSCLATCNVVLPVLLHVM